MKKFLCLMCLSLLLAGMTFAAPERDTGQQPSYECMIVQADAPMVMDFVLVDYSAVTNATVAVTGYKFYQAPPMEYVAQVFDLELQVFRLCIDRSRAYKSNVYNSWRVNNTNPPNKYDRA